MNKATQKILVLGAGGFARSIADIVEDIPGNKVVGFVVNIPPFVRGSETGGKPIYWIDDLETLDKTCKIVNSIVSPEKKIFNEQVRKLGFSFISIIHPSAYVSRSAKIGNGVIINSGVQIAANAAIEDFVIINRGTLIGHDVILQAYSYVSTGANIASFVNVGRMVRISMGVNIVEHVNIGENAVVGAGSLVTQDIPDSVRVLGVPARIIERKIHEG